jgi:ferrochelatase
VKGLLVMAYGTPETLDDVRPYLKHIRHGHEPSDEAVEALRRRYEMIGGPSPLYRTTVRQMEALVRRLNESGGRYRGYLGMKHWRPHIPDTVRKMAADGIEEAVAITLAPHYSTMSIAQYLDYVREGLDGLGSLLRVLCIKSYHDEPLFVEALAERLQEALEDVPDDLRRDLTVVFTAHSLPEKILKADDPYRDQLLETSRRVAERFEGLDWRFAFTSAGATKEKWLGPSLAEVLAELAGEGRRAVLACTVGFVSEHLETLYDFDIEGRRDAERLGLAFYRAPALGTSETFIAALADVVCKAEAGALAEAAWLPGDELEAPTYPTYTEGP